MKGNVGTDLESRLWGGAEDYFRARIFIRRLPRCCKHWQGMSTLWFALFCWWKKNSSSPSQSRFSTFCWHRSYKFPPLSENPPVLRKLLMMRYTVSEQNRQKVRWYKAILSKISMTAKWVSRAQDDSTFNPTITVKGNAWRYIGALVPPRHIRRPYTSVYVQHTDEVQWATIRGTNASQNLSQSVLIDVWFAITQASSYAQTFQSLRAWEGRHSPDIYKIFIHAGKRSASEHARKLNAPNLLNCRQSSWERTTGK